MSNPIISLINYKILPLFHLIIVILSTTVLAATFTVDTTQEFQKIDGFGAHGAGDVWWGDGPFWNDDLLDLVINNLGFNICRNQYYPPTNSIDFAKQAPFLQAMRDYAKAQGEPMKFMVTIWSPPAYMKSNGSTTDGGNLLPDYYDEYADYLIGICEDYQNVGIDLYAISPQNEPDQSVFYNSCYYTPQTYVEMINVVVPIFKASAFGNVTNILGAEDMIWVYGGSGSDNAYNFALTNNATAHQNMDIWGYHAYPQAHENPSQMPQWFDDMGQWSTTANVGGKPIWQTETCRKDLADYDGHTAALGLAQAIQWALGKGRNSAYLFWQMVYPGTSDEAILTDQGGITRRAAMMKHFSRFIRPGARMVSVTGISNDYLTMTAFKRNTGNDEQWAMVIVNSTSSMEDITITGKGLPAEFDVYQTTSSGSLCELLSGKITRNLTVPAQSITTLVSGDYIGGEGAEQTSIKGSTNKNLVSTSRNITITRGALGKITCAFPLADPSHMKISIVTINGRLVTTLIDSRLAAGTHTIDLSPANKTLPTGIYLLKADINNTVTSCLVVF